jgi:hypothetical protein
MDPRHQLRELLQEHSFDLVRQRKHRIYRNPDGLMFVTASTPSDRRASRNALSTLKRVLRGVGSDFEPTQAAGLASSADSAPEIQASGSISPPPAIESIPMIEPESVAMSDQEWEAWKRRYWHDEKLRAKNEKFLSLVGIYVDRASELFHKHEGIGLAPVTDTVKRILCDCHYKSKVLLYHCRSFEQGIVALDLPHVPVLWASNGHVGVSAFLLINTYVQHGTSRAKALRFDWDGTAVLFELPEKGARKFYVGPASHSRKENRGGRTGKEGMVGCPACHNTQELPPLQSMVKDQGWRCNRCGTVHGIPCPFCKAGTLTLTDILGFCPNCSKTPIRATEKS